MKVITIRTLSLLIAISYVSLLIFAWFLDSIAIFFVCCILVGVIIAFFKGRFWCNWMCPRGQLYDYLVGRISRHKEYPESLQNSTLQFLIMFFITSLLIYNVAIHWGDWVAVSRIFLVLITFTTIVGIIIGIFYQPRSWCQICSAATITKHVGLDKETELIEDKEKYLKEHKDKFK